MKKAIMSIFVGLVLVLATAPATKTAAPGTGQVIKAAIKTANGPLWPPDPCGVDMDCNGSGCSSCW